MTVSEFMQSGDNQYNTRKRKTSEKCTYTTLIHMGYVILIEMSQEQLCMFALCLINNTSGTSSASVCARARAK